MENISKRKLLLLVIIIIIAIIGLFYFSLKTKNTNLVEKNNIQEKQNNNSYIGHIYPPDPEGVISDINQDRYLGSAVIMKTDYSESTPYSLQGVKTPRGYELWLNKLIDSDVSGKPKFIITDSLLIPKEEISSYLFGGLCGKEDSLSPNAGLALDSTIIASVNIKEYYSKGRAPSLLTWKVNLETGKYEVYSSNGVFCVDPSAGIDTD